MIYQILKWANPYKTWTQFTAKQPNSLTNRSSHSKCIQACGIYWYDQACIRYNFHVGVNRQFLCSQATDTSEKYWGLVSWSRQCKRGKIIFLFPATHLRDQERTARLCSEVPWTRCNRNMLQHRDLHRDTNKINHHESAQTWEGSAQRLWNLLPQRYWSWATCSNWTHSARNIYFPYKRR